VQDNSLTLKIIGVIDYLLVIFCCFIAQFMFVACANKCREWKSRRSRIGMTSRPIRNSRPRNQSQHSQVDSLYFNDGRAGPESDSPSFFTKLK